MCIYIYIYVCICYLYKHNCMCTYTYIYIYTDIHTYICIYHMCVYGARRVEPQAPPQVREQGTEYGLGASSMIIIIIIIIIITIIIVSVIIIITSIIVIIIIISSSSSCSCSSSSSGSILADCTVSRLGRLGWKAGDLYSWLRLLGSWKRERGRSLGVHRVAGSSGRRGPLQLRHQGCL